MSKHNQAKKHQAPQGRVGGPDRPRAGVAPSAAPASNGPAPPGGSANGSSVTREQIAIRAYELWEARGRPVGTDREDWFEAERQLRGRTGPH